MQRTHKLEQKGERKKRSKRGEAIISSRDKVIRIEETHAFSAQTILPVSSTHNPKG